MPEHLELPAPDSGRAFRIGLLTDIHIGNASLRARQELAFARMDSLGLRLLCLMGDIVDNAMPHHYRLAEHMLAKLDTPTFALTGNHELFPATMPVEVCLEHFRQGMGRPRQYGFRYLDPYLFVFLGIDQREPQMPRTRRDTGTSVAQLTWLSALLDAHRHTPTIIISHAPLADTVEDSGHFPLAASPVLAEILAGAPQVCLWLSGHTHLPDVHQGQPLKTRVEFAPGRFFVHVPPVADYYVHVVNDNRQFFRDESLHSRLLVCHPNRIEVLTYDLLTNVMRPFVTVRPSVPARQTA